MKKIIAILMSVCLFIGLCACGCDSNSTISTTESEATLSPIEQAQAKLSSAITVVTVNLGSSLNNYFENN